MRRILTYQIKKEDAGQTILAYLRQKHYSRSVIVSLKKTEDGIQVNHKWSYVNYKLKEGDILTIQLIETAQTAQAVPLPISIVYEDNDILVVDKPAYMPIHPSIGNYNNTLANAAAFHAKERQEQYPYRCINRLDRDTSGLTIIAKNPYSSCILYEQMRNRQIHRSYYAIVEGMTEKYGTVDAPIARREGTIIERMVSYTDGERAVTNYETLAYLQQENLSFIKLQLETGRTHQIRVHMCFLGHPLIGDFLYNAKDTRMARQALHAGLLEFAHPVTGQPLSFAAPLPEDMRQFFDFTFF